MKATSTTLVLVLSDGTHRVAQWDRAVPREEISQTIRNIQRNYVGNACVLRMFLAQGGFSEAVDGAALAGWMS